VDEPIPDVARALRLDPDNEVAGWLAGQALVDQVSLVPVAACAFQDTAPPGIGPVMQALTSGAFVINYQDGVLHRCTISDTEDAIRIAPWPEDALRCPAPCMEVAVSPDEKYVAAVLADGSLCVYAVKDGRRLWECPGTEGLVHGVLFSPSGRRVVQVSRRLNGEQSLRVAGGRTVGICDAVGQSASSGNG